ncbi:MAG: hypothetical protein V2I46_06145 [Bacteroides sp.]|jgi:hypothetical protein|nr:hypothetical protein [Bacteroides sp.]
MNTNILTNEPAESFLPKFSFWIALLTAIVTLGTFVTAVLTPPLSGPFCLAGCFEYPYLDIASRFPRDYYWMVPAIFVFLLAMVLVICVHHYAEERKKLFSQAGFAFAILSAGLLVTNYFLQLSVIQPSLLKGETDGISILSQFNPHGVFIVLEELGFLLMTLSFFALTPVFSGKRGLQITLFSGFPLALAALAIITAVHGIHREYLFEVAVISISWLQLIIASSLMSVMFFRELKKTAKRA